MSTPAAHVPDRVRALILPDWYPSVRHPVFGTFIREKARAIARREDVSVLYAEAVGARVRIPWSVEHEVDEGVATTRVLFRAAPVPYVSFGVRLAAMAAGLRAIERRGFRPQLIHAHVYPAGAAAVLLARRRGIPVIVSENHTGFPRRTLSAVDRRIARFAFEHAALVCPASEDLGRQIAAHGIEARMEAVPNVVDVDRFVAPPGVRRPDGPVRLLTVALLDPKKGIDHLLRALARVHAHRQYVVLEIVGDGPEREPLERLAAELGISGIVRFRGVLDKAGVARAMWEAHAFVLPSLWENLPNVIIEALAAGLPVIATTCGGVPEMIDDPRLGELVAPGDSEALAAALDRMLDGHGGYDRDFLSATARERYGFDAVGARWSGVYRRVLAGAAG
jgi:glycosyltransferase involved in cell wall biosynthesis